MVNVLQGPSFKLANHAFLTTELCDTWWCLSWNIMSTYETLTKAISEAICHGRVDYIWDSLYRFLLPFSSVKGTKTIAFGNKAALLGLGLNRPFKGLHMFIVMIKSPFVYFLLPSYDITKTWLVGFNDGPRATFIMMFQEQHQHCNIRSCFPSGYLSCKQFLNLPPWKCIRSHYCNIKSHTMIYHFHMMLCK